MEELVFQSFFCSLRHKDVDITAVVTVADDGGSSGNLRDIMQLTPPGDLRNVFVAMSDMPKLYERVFQYRFDKTDGALAGHPLWESCYRRNFRNAGIYIQRHAAFNQVLSCDRQDLPCQ